MYTSEYMVLTVFERGRHLALLSRQVVVEEMCGVCSKYVAAILCDGESVAEFCFSLESEFWSEVTFLHSIQMSRKMAGRGKSGGSHVNVFTVFQ